MTFTDQLGRVIELPYYPVRIISLVPSQTELLYDLGLDSEIVGRTKFCIHPAEKIKQAVKIGGTKNLDIKKIHSLKPDLIIANKEENTEEQINELAQKYPVWISDIHNMNDAMGMIRTIGELTNRRDKASLLIEEVNKKANAMKKNKILYVAYLIWYKPFMTVGSDTFIHSMLETAAFKNIFDSEKRYPEVSLEEIISRRPDYIFLSSEPYPFKEKQIEEINYLYPQQKVQIVDGEMFSWYGSRMIKAFDYFEELRKSLK